MKNVLILIAFLLCISCKKNTPEISLNQNVVQDYSGFLMLQKNKNLLIKLLITKKKQLIKYLSIL